MPEQKKPKPVTLDYLKRSSLHYLNRFDATEAKLEEVLTRRVRKRLHGSGENPENYHDLIMEAVKYCVKVGYINDENYATRLIERAQEKGESKIKTKQKLKLLGIEEDFIKDTMDELEFSDEASAIAWARKKKIGKFRQSDRDTYKEKDLAKLARQGFSYEIARKIVLESNDLEDGEY